MSIPAVAHNKTALYADAAAFTNFHPANRIGHGVAVAEAENESALDQADHKYADSLPYAKFQPANRMLQAAASAENKRALAQATTASKGHALHLTTLQSHVNAIAQADHKTEIAHRQTASEEDELQASYQFRFQLRQHAEQRRNAQSAEMSAVFKSTMKEMRDTLKELRLENAKLQAELIKSQAQLRDAEAAHKSQRKADQKLSKTTTDLLTKRLDDLEKVVWGHVHVLQPEWITTNTASYTPPVVYKTPLEARMAAAAMMG